MGLNRQALARTLSSGAFALSLAGVLPPVFAQSASNNASQATATAASSNGNDNGTRGGNGSTRIGTPSSAAQSFGLLRGKFPFSLPASYAGRELLARSGPPDSGNSWATMYMSDEDRQIVVVSEARNPSGTQVGDNDNIFLTGSGVGYNRQQQRAHPDYKVISEKTIVVNGLGIRRIEATDIIDGGDALSTALLAASGSTLAVVQVISGIKDRAEHEALVARVLAGGAKGDSPPAK